MFGPRTIAVALIASASGLAGCIGTTDDLASSSGDPTGGLLDPVLELLSDNGGFRINQGIDVVLVGFDAGVGKALQDVLEPEEVHHNTGSFDRIFPPDPADPQMPLGGASWSNPAITVGHFRVIEVAPDASAALLASFAKAEIEPGIYDANAAEQTLFETLPTVGAPIDAARHTYVVVHGRDVLAADHAWRYTYSDGYLQPVRTFGERTPLLVTDVSAKPDPYVLGEEVSPTGLVFGAVFGPSESRPYDRPIGSGADSAGVIRDLVVDAAHHRFLKGAIYPISTKPCHHVTLILAIHTTALTQYAPGFRSPEEWVDVAAMEGGFENLTGEDVIVEYKVLNQPQDDPVLDALSRGAGGFVTLDALRWYLDENWSKFVTPVPGCEEYLALTIFGDLGQNGAFGGIGTYDVKRSHRIAFSLVPEASRLRDQSGELRSMVDGPDESRPVPNWVNLLFSHEAGHILGQHHPQHLSKADAASPTIHTFESVWSVMSYQTDDRTVDFGKNDRAQWLRNRAGFAVQEAQMLDVTGTPEFEDALKHLEMHHFAAAHHALVPVLSHESDGHSHANGLPDYHIIDRHYHPWFDQDGNWVGR